MCLCVYVCVCVCVCYVERIFIMQTDVLMPDWTTVTYSWFVFVTSISQDSRSQWPRDLSREIAAACLLRLWVRIPPRAWMSL